MPTKQAQAEAEGEINQLIQRYARAADIGGGGAQAACFTPEGFIGLPGGIRRDQAQIAAAKEADPVKRRHFFTPPIITFTSDDAAKGEGYCLSVSFAEASRKPSAPYSIDYSDEYRRTP